MEIKEQIEALKNEWLNDPSWDIEDTKGFEEYRNELRQWREGVEKTWRDQMEQDRETEVNQMAENLSCSVELAEYVMTLETKIRTLTRYNDFIERKIEKRLDDLEEQVDWS